MKKNTTAMVLPEPPVIEGIVQKSARAIKSSTSDFPDTVLMIGHSEGPINNATVIRREISWDKLQEELKSPEMGEKNGSYFTCLPFKNNHRNSKNAQGQIGDIFVLDGDSSIDPDTGALTEGAPPPANVSNVLTKLDITHCIYSSHSNGAKGHRYRVVIPCQWDSKEELEALVAWVVQQLHDKSVWLNNVKENTNISCAWFYSRLPDNAAKKSFEFYQHDGQQPFPKDEALEWHRKTNKPAKDRGNANTGLSAPSAGNVNIDEIKNAIDSLDPDMPYKDWLRVGMALHSTGHPDVFDIWNEWSSRDTKRYRPDVMEKKWNSFSLREDQVNISTLFYMARQAGWQGMAIDTEAALLEQYVYLAEPDRFYNSHTGEILKPTGFNSLFRHLKIARSTANWFTGNLAAKKVSALVYYPGKPTSKIYFRGKKCWNTYRKADITPVSDVTDDMVRPYLDHVEYIITDEKEREHLLDILAFTVQQPDIKINQAILLGGKPRIGKDTVFQPLIHAVGSHNVSQPGAHELKASFNGFLAKHKVVIFQEIQNFEKSDTENKLKPMLASPPDTLRVNEKYLAAYEIPNVVFCIFMSNHRNALKISPGDGRYFAIWSDVDKKPDEYYIKLYDWLEQENGNNLVASWLTLRDISGFKPKAPAMDTKYKQELIALGRTDVEFNVQNLIEDAANGTLKPLMHFIEILEILNPTGLYGNRNSNLANKSVRTALEECGAKPRKFRRSTGSRERVSLWILADIEHYSALPPQQLIQAYDNLQASIQPEPKAKRAARARNKGRK